MKLSTTLLVVTPLMAGCGLVEPSGVEVDAGRSSSSASTSTASSGSSSGPRASGSESALIGSSSAHASAGSATASSSGSSSSSSSATAIALFGGADQTTGTTLGDTWTFDGSTWTEHTVTGPSPRSNAAAAGLGGKMVLTGGIDAHGNLLDDTWTWDGASWAEVNAPAPSARTGAVAATLGDTVVLFGGTAYVGSNPSTEIVLGDTWVFDGQTWTQETVSGPPARSNAAMATLGDKVVLFGGVGGTVDPASGAFQPLGDTWTWDGSSWTEQDVAGPVAEGEQVAVNDGDLVLFLGAGSTVNGDSNTWFWNGTSWHEPNVAELPPSVGPMGATLNGVPVVVCGDPSVGDPSHPRYIETFLWASGVWTEMPIPGPSPRMSGAMASF